MHLTRATDYALRVLLYLSVETERYVPASEISGAFGISAHHVRTVAKDLVNRGWVVGQRGQGGGLKLAVDPGRLRLGDVVRALEDLHLLECFAHESDQCAISPACRLKAVLRAATSTFLEALDATTLADLVSGRERRLRRLLALFPPGEEGRDRGRPT